MPIVGANLFIVNPAVPRIGSATLLTYVVPPSVMLWPAGVVTVAAMLLSL